MNIHSPIIIPDDEINNLPFEVPRWQIKRKLPDLKDTMDLSIRSQLIDEPGEIYTSKPNVLGFALFADRSGQIILINWNIPEMKWILMMATKLLNKDATSKEKPIVILAKHHNVIHLATYTIINDTLPENSYIIGYKPRPQDAANIYSLNLPIESGNADWLFWVLRNR